MLVGPGDLTAQTEQVLANLGVALADAGARPEDVVRTTVYVVTTEREDLGVVWDAVQASGLARAASTLLGVALLGMTNKRTSRSVGGDGTLLWRT